MNCVSVRVLGEGEAGGTPLLLSEEGYLGKIETNLLLEVSAAPDPNCRVYGLVVDGNKNVTIAKNQHAENAENGENGNGHKLYRIAISVKRNEEGIFFTRYPQNHLRLACFRPAGLLELWEISIVSQKGNFWLRWQLTYQVNCYCYRKKRRLFCPKFQKSWPSLVQALNEVPGFRQLVKKLPALPKTVATPKESRSPITRDNHGLVLWYNLAQGRGAILTKHGQATVHWSQVHRPDSSFQYLKANELVRFKGLRQPKQTRGRPTSFKREAVEATPL